MEEEDDEPGDDLKEQNIMQTIKDAVHKVVNVFRPKNATLALQTNGSQLAGASLRYCSLLFWSIALDILDKPTGTVFCLLASRKRESRW